MRTNKVIEFTGIPNSGKTTLIHRLQEELPNKYGITVQVQREDAEIVPPDIPKKTWDRNLWITFGQMQSLVEAYHSPADIVLLDRGFFDAYFWANFMCDQGTASVFESSAVLQMLEEMQKYLNFCPDCLFLIDSSVEEALKRRALMEGASVYSKPDFLNTYREKFFELFKDFIEEISLEKRIYPVPSFYLDTTSMNADEVFEKVAQQIVKICGK